MYIGVDNMIQSKGTYGKIYWNNDAGYMYYNIHIK